MIIRVLIPVIAMGSLGLVFGVGLAYALKLFRIEVDPTIALIITKLPGANCGACGKAGCAGFAEALKKGELLPAGCAVTNEEARKSISEILGIEHTVKVKTIATVLCNGGVNAVDKYAYKGIRTCKAATLVFGGQKACSFGCLGFGDCVIACPFGAIRMTDKELPEVDPAKCTACGICVKVCPKSLFILTPTKNNYYVKCKSTDPGAVVAKVCKTGCIACRKCEKACPIQAVKVESNLARIYYDKCQNIGECFKVCPTKVIQKRG